MNSTIVDNLERHITELKGYEYKLEGQERLHLFQIRRKLEKTLFEHHKQGSRIPLRSEFELACEKCGAIQDNEDQYYLHLRKVHGIKDLESVKLTNEQRESYETEVQMLRELLTKHTEFDLEDDFTRGFASED